ncbi:MAG: hypothetical protein IKP64_13365 [Selenomonadaceae bacterium]|nr:hypothetical protein [Selenomonadaceae bacterium]
MVSKNTVVNMLKVFHDDMVDFVENHSASNFVDFAGATSIAGGASGIVPAPQAGDENKFLRGDGTWATVSSGSSAIFLSLPTQNGSLTYNGAEQSPSWANYDPAQILIGGTTAATDAGTYTATFTPQGLCTWTDGTSNTKQVTWTIAKAAVNLSANIAGAVAFGSTGTIAISGNAGGGTVTATSSDDIVVSVQSATTSSVIVECASISATDTTITINVAETNNYLSGSTTCAVSTEKASFELPTVTGTEFTYDGDSHTPTIGAYNTSLITATNTAQTDAGDYEIVFALNDKTNCEWSDGTTADKTVAWSIAKASCTLSLSETSGIVGLDDTKTFTVTTPSDGTLSVNSSDTEVATATISGTTVTVTGKGAGNAIITVSQAAGTNYNAPESQTFSATVQIVVGNTLNETSWATISAVAKAGIGDTHWDIGDCKEITLNGGIGNQLTLSNQTLCVFILHFNYAMNGTADNNIIWGGFKTALTSGKDVALCDSKLNNGVMDGTICFNMNHRGQTSTGNGYYGTNYGGWKGTDLRYDILGATSQAPSQYNQLKSTSNVGYNATAATLTSPKANTVLAALPSDFRNALRLWSRWIDAKGNSSNVEANIEETIDAVSLLTEFEVQGARTYANEYEKNHQKQMDYYKSGNSKIKYNHSSTSSAVWWWLASPYCNSSSTFCRVHADGSASNNNARNSYAVAPAFKV